jgi:hypothetical protein
MEAHFPPVSNSVRSSPFYFFFSFQAREGAEVNCIDKDPSDEIPTSGIQLAFSDF